MPTCWCFLSLSKHQQYNTGQLQYTFDKKMKYEQILMMHCELFSSFPLSNHTYLKVKYVAVMINNEGANRSMYFFFFFLKRQPAFCNHKQVIKRNVKYLFASKHLYTTLITTVRPRNTFFTFIISSRQSLVVFHVSSKAKFNVQR